MNERAIIGRNDPCPCGSGKKYKKCCAQTSRIELQSRDPLYFDLEVDRDKVFFELNKAIAYKGQIGNQRKEFCIAYIARKKALFSETEGEINKVMQQSGKTITCRRGCCACCSLYTEANIQECEVIAYYLYQNKNALSTFLDNYPHWREKIRENGDLFRPCGELWNKTLTPITAPFFHSSHKEATNKYANQVISCPFLYNTICSIYEVRPYLCAGFVVTDPKEWCNPLHPKYKLSGRLTATPSRDILILDTSFYYKSLLRPVITFVPIIVYEILKGGFAYLSKLPGIEGLRNEVMNDSSIKKVLEAYSVTYY
jgi:Fe-S-cluster containining protein